ncbi:MAG: hypothetical protein RL522_1113 [Pseudomonadota bacterium]
MPTFLLRIRSVFLALSLLCVATLARSQGFQFIALGDLPYGHASQAPYRALIDRINQLAPAFSVHVGDIKSGSTLCSDEEFAAQWAHFQRYTGAVVYTPGDNEWTDCHRANNGAHDPLERLAALRQRFFTEGRSLGQRPIAVENQSRQQPAHARYVENQRWQHQGVVFATVHVVGSNNNFEVRDPAAVREFFERDAANVAWLESTFEQARRANAQALVVALQADMFESRSVWEDFPSWSGFRRVIGETLLPLARQWGKPVLVVHGDTHRFRIDQPFTLDNKPLANITRLIVPGANDVRAVRVTVQAGGRFVFEVVEPNASSGP